MFAKLKKKMSQILLQKNCLRESLDKNNECLPVAVASVAFPLDPVAFASVPLVRSLIKPGK